MVLITAGLQVDPGLASGWEPLAPRPPVKHLTPRIVKAQQMCHSCEKRGPQ